MIPGFTGCFGSFNIIHPCPATCFQVEYACPHGSPLRIQSHLEAFSAVSVVFLMALLLAVPIMPRALKALWSEWPTNPLLPTSMGIHLAFQLCCRQRMTSRSYLVLFFSWASPKRSSHGTVSSINTMFLVLSETSRMSGLMVVLTMCWGNRSCFSRSTESCQSWAIAKIPAGAFLQIALGWAPALTKKRLHSWCFVLGWSC